MDEASVPRVNNLHLRESVRRFAELMELKLRENDHKGGWESEHEASLFRSAELEMDELRFAIYIDGRRESIIDECVDVANFAMMIADITKGLDTCQGPGRSETLHEFLARRPQPSAPSPSPIGTSLVVDDAQIRTALSGEPATAGASWLETQTSSVDTGTVLIPLSTRPKAGS